MENIIIVENETNFPNAEIIVVSNYFLPEKNKIVNWHMNNKYFTEYSHYFDIGVWKIKQLKK
jgi:hypothetical protein